MGVLQRDFTVRRVLLGVMTVGGSALILLSLFRLLSSNTGPKLPFLFIMVLFAVTSKLSIPLPSGASWRPGISLLMPAMLLLPTWMLPLVAIPGLVLLTPRSRLTWSHYPTSFAHVALGLYSGSLVFHWALALHVSNPHLAYFQAMAAAVFALATHLLINRILSIIIVSNRQNRSFKEQLRLVAHELHWGYFTSYLGVLMTYAIARTHLWWALFLSVLVQLGLYKMMSYYQMLQESEQRYRSLKEHHPDGICSLDLRGKFVTQNLSFQKLLGYSDEHLLRMNFVDLIDCKDPVTNESCLTLLSGDVDREVFLTVRHYLGMPIEVSCTSVPIIVEGHRAGLYLIVKDVAEQRRAEELLLQSEKLTIVGQLAAGVAHEIRNPLTSLQGFVQLMRSSDLREEHLHYLSIMEEELNRIEIVAGEFLMLAKPHAVRTGLVELRETLLDVTTLLSTLATMRDIEIRTEFLGHIPRIECDENQLKQVFINIAKNGIEAMENGTLTIRVYATEAAVLVQIEDQGVGIPEDTLHMVGYPFYTTKPQGTGLGLTVSQKIIESYSGDMQIQSRAGRGTVVTISLPAPVSDDLTVLARM